MTGDDLAAAMPATARALFGEPVGHLSSAREWRYGRRGSLAIDVERGLWRDHEAGTGGGVLALIQRERGGDHAAASRWLGELESGFRTPCAGARARLSRMPSEGFEARCARAHAMRSEPRSAARPSDAERSDYALAIWRQANPPEDTPVSAYLASRGLDLGLLGQPPSERVRFAPACPFGRGVRLPVMLALLTDIASGEPVGIRRTALRLSGGRALDASGAKLPHKALGRAGNAVARLCGQTAPPHALGLCEGVETGLSVAAATGATVWACPAGTLSGFPVLPGAERLTIFADNDAPGLAAARKTARRWAEAGRGATIEYPTRPGADFNDIWKEQRNG